MSATWFGLGLAVALPALLFLFVSRDMRSFALNFLCGMWVNAVLALGLLLGYAILNIEPWAVDAAIEEPIKLLPFLILRKEVSAFVVSMSFGATEFIIKGTDFQGEWPLLLVALPALVMHLATSSAYLYVALRHREGLWWAGAGCVAAHLVFNDVITHWQLTSDGREIFVPLALALLFSGFTASFLIAARPFAIRTNI